MRVDRHESASVIHLIWLLPISLAGLSASWAFENVLLNTGTVATLAVCLLVSIFAHAKSRDYCLLDTDHGTLRVHSFLPLGQERITEYSIRDFKGVVSYLSYGTGMTYTMRSGSNCVELLKNDGSGTGLLIAEFWAPKAFESHPGFGESEKAKALRESLSRSFAIVDLGFVGLRQSHEPGSAEAK